MAQYPLTVWSTIACCYPLGMIPKAPGTWGSLPGVLVGVAIYQGSQLMGSPTLFAIISLVLLTVFSWLAIDKTEKLWQVHDDKRIVIDEVAGQAIPLAFFGAHWQLILASFLLFRFFDILKPGPIGWVDEKLPGASGTLFDDSLAGLVVLGLVYLERTYWPLFAV